MTIIIRKKKFLKKSNIVKKQDKISRVNKPIQNNISSCDKIFEELDKGSSLINAEKIEKELIEKVDNKENNTTDLVEQLNKIKIKSSTITDYKSNKQNKKKFLIRKTIIKLRRLNRKIKRFNLQKKYKIFKNKKRKFIIKYQKHFIFESITYHTSIKKIENILKIIEKNNEVKGKLKDKKFYEKKTLIKNKINHNQNKKEVQKNISKTEKAEDKNNYILNALNSGNINNNMNNIPFISENNNNVHIQSENEGNNFINNNVENMSISSSNSNSNNVNHINNEERNGQQINNQNQTESEDVESLEDSLSNDENNNLNQDFINNNNHNVKMYDYLEYVNTLPAQEEEEDFNNIENFQSYSII